MKKLTVGEVMTQAPHTIGEDRTLSDAHEMMQKYKIRHLPVLKRAKLVGILTDRDLNLVETFNDVDPKTVRVKEAMALDPYVVAKTQSVAEVAKGMADSKVGSAIVWEKERVIGIFTTVDACRVLAKALA